MNRRYREILNSILNTEGCITGAELAKHCNVSVRTVREDIKGLNELLMGHGIRIDAIINKGYCLNEENKRIIKQHSIMKSVLDHEDIMGAPASPLDRQMYILAKLTGGNRLHVDELADALHVSQSTINKDIASVKKWLKTKPKTDLQSSLNDGISLKADESTRRNIISWILGARLNASTISKYWQYLFGEKEINSSSAALYQIVRAKTNENGYYLSGHSSQSFCLEILAAAKRQQAGHTVTEAPGSALSKVMAGIREDAEAFLGAPLPDAAWRLLQQQFEAKQFLFGTDTARLVDKETITVVDDFLGTIADKFNIKLNLHEEAREKLLLYIGPMLRRVRFSYCLPNPINESDIKTRQLEYKLAKEMATIIKRELGLPIGRIEIVYLSVLLESMNKFWKQKLRTAIVSDFDESVNSLLRENVAARFGDSLSIARLYTYQDFMYAPEEALAETDFVISTSTIAAITDIAFVVVHPIMGKKDFDSISDCLEKLKMFKR